MAKKDATSTEELAKIPKVPKGFRPYTDRAISFSVAYPENWKKMSASERFLVGFEVPEAERGVRTNFVVAHEKLSPQDALQTYFAWAKIELENKFKEYHIISEEEITIDKIPAVKHVFTFVDKGTTFKQIAIYLKQGKTGWVVSLTTTPEDFDSYQPTFKAMAASFHLFGASRGEQAGFIPSLEPMKNDIRGWGVALMIMGIIQIAVPLLSTPWGGVLIALGLTELFFQHRSLYIVNGIVIIIAGVMNMIVGIEEGTSLVLFAILQFIWGANELRKFFKYRAVRGT